MIHFVNYSFCFLPTKLMPRSVISAGLLFYEILFTFFFDGFIANKRIEEEVDTI